MKTTPTQLEPKYPTNTTMKSLHKTTQPLHSLSLLLTQHNTTTALLLVPLLTHLCLRSAGGRLWHGQVRRGHCSHVGDAAGAHHEVYYPCGDGWYHCYLRPGGGGAAGRQTGCSWSGIHSLPVSVGWRVVLSILKVGWGNGLFCLYSKCCVETLFYKVIYICGVVFNCVGGVGSFSVR